MKSDRIYLDVECYKDYFLVSFLRESTGNILDIELHADLPLDKEKLAAIMGKNQTISFNGNGYDLYMITAALKGFPNEKLKTFSDKIIKSNLPSWRIAKDHGIHIPSRWDHIDVMDVAPGIASLKIYGGRLGAPKLQDLPIKPDDSITPELREPIRCYCHNDLYTTQYLSNKLIKQIELRESMSDQYGVDLRSKSDAQIAETVIKSELEKMTGKTYRRFEAPDDYGFHYKDPGIIEFKTEKLKAIFKNILAHKFELSGNGSVKMPDFLKKEPIEFDGAKYQMGIGGLHSCEKKQYIKPSSKQLLFDIDVASYYPNIILQQRMAPKSMGAQFLKVYQSIVDRRIKAKKRVGEIEKELADLKRRLKMDNSEILKKIEALESELAYQKAQTNTLKISINGSFGKLGSKWSTLYAPELLIQTTITGQLALLMLIESLAEKGIKTVSANTDGVVVLCDKDQEQTVEEIVFDWELTTSYTLERTDYAALASRDVNNYLAVKPDGSTKGKGVFAPAGLSKNPDTLIVYKAVADFISKGVGIEQTIKECKDVRQFVKVRQVKGGAIWRGEELGKATRFYYSSDIPNDECLRYAINGNKVPMSDGARPIMDLPDNPPTDIDYKRYIDGAKQLLKECGYA